MKLAVCDLDGTLLLKGEKSLKKDILKSVEDLRKKQVLFACASGRTYGEMRRIFCDENIIYIPFDGGGAYFENKPFFETPLSAEALSGFNDAENVVFHSRLVSYIKSENKMFLRENAARYNGHIQKISDISEIAEPVFKITVSQNSGALQSFCGDVKRIYDGREFADFADKGADKGEAVKKVCGILGISFEELFVIGDNLNDISMMNLTDNSYCVYGAKYETRKAAKHEIGSAAEFLKKICL